MSQKVKSNFSFVSATAQSKPRSALAEPEPFGSAQSSDWAAAETKLNLNLQATWFNTEEIA